MKHDCKFFVEYFALDLLMDQVRCLAAAAVWIVSAALLNGLFNASRYASLFTALMVCYLASPRVCRAGRAAA